MRERVLIVHNYYKIPGGEDQVVKNEKKLLEEHGHPVFLYTRSNREMDGFSLCQKLILPLTSLFSLRTFREVKKLIREQAIDVVHVHNTLNLISPSVYYAAFACKKPVIQTLHNFRMLCPAATFLRDGKICEECVSKGLGCAVRYKCYRDSRIQSMASAMILRLHRFLGTYRRLYYICLTEFNRQKLLRLNQGGRVRVREDRVFIKPNFVPDIGQKREKKGEYYLYIGRLDQSKGIYTLLEAWKEFPDRRLLICGSGEEEERIRSCLDSCQMKQVELLGQLSHEQVLELLAGAKALLMPTEWYEGQPMVILESFAAGTPVIASDLGNAGAMVEEGVSGLRFACKDIAALQTAVQQFEKGRGWNPREVYERKYTPEMNYQMLREIYARAQGRTSSAGPLSHDNHPDRH